MPKTGDGPVIAGRRGVALLAVAAVLTAGACSGERTERLRAAKNGATPGGNLVVGITPPGTVEPSNAYEPMGALVASAICEPLVQLDPVTGDPVPGIAESWLVSDEGKRFTVKLRKGVRFHDGRTLTADDVVYSLSRLASQDNASAEAKLLAPVAGYDEVHGDKPTDNADKRETLAGLNVVQSTSFEIRLKAANADFMRVLAHVATAPVSKRAARGQGAEFDRQPVCAGPYRVQAPWTPADPQIVVHRFDRYYGKNPGYTSGGSGYPDTITFKVFSDPAALRAAYGAGAVDIAPVDADGLAAARAHGADLHVAGRGAVEYIGLPPKAAPFDNPRVRRALSLALDRTQAIAAGLGGAGVPATGFVPPNVGDVFTANACGPTVAPTADVDGARARLRDAGVSLSGTRVSLSFNDEFGNRALVENVAQQWQAAFGLIVDFTPMIWDKYAAQGEGAQGFDGLFRLSWRADYPSADAYLHPLFHSGNIGQANFARFSDPAFDRRIQRQARTATDDDARRFDYRHLEALVCERLPLIPVAFVQSGVLVRTTAVGSAGDVFTERATGLPALRELFVRRA